MSRYQTVKSNPKAAPRRQRNVAVRLLRGILTLALISFLYLVACRWVMPPVTLIQLGSFFGGHGLNRDYVSYDEISSNMKLAVLASEDQLFPDHNGFDWKAIDKSMNKPEKKGRVRGGAASTISQQTAKNVFLWSGTGWTRYIRKGLEAPYTAGIEALWPKKRILEVYLNVIETGPGLFGVEAAAQHYFRKSAAKLSRKEAAQIAAGLPAPKKFTVVPLSARVKSRTPWILRQMSNLEDDPDVKALLQ